MAGAYFQHAAPAITAAEQRSKGPPTVLPKEVIPATEEEKECRVTMLGNLHQARAAQSAGALKPWQAAAIHKENVFDVLMEATAKPPKGSIRPR